MTLNVYSIKDSKAGTFSNPYYSINDSTAIRSFEQAAADPSTTISQFPTDYSLYKLGTFDDSSGTISRLDDGTPLFVANPTTKKEAPTA